MNTLQRCLNTIFCLLVLSANLSLLQSQPSANDSIQLLIRCDDLGMCHSVNLAAKRLFESGLPVSVSIMFACPWYQEAVDLLKQYPDVSAGVHLTLNAEWKNYRWGPVLGKVAVPSLVDSIGFFFPSRATFFANNPKIAEVEKELRAQIERALSSGIRIDYLDYHMGTVVDTPELRALLERLANEYHLGISRYFGERDVAGVYKLAPETKTDSLLATISGLKNGPVQLLVCHIGLDTPEMSALIDLNTFGLAQMSKHREAELNALLSNDFRKIIKDKKIRLLTYRDIIRRMGLDKMQRPGVE
ncbi:MAG: ChbG/HpnK family deacetylase [bacterium]